MKNLLTEFRKFVMRGMELLEAIQILFFTRERLHHPHAGNVLRHRGCQTGCLSPHPAMRFQAVHVK